jgi:hypothetical protein
MQQIFVGNYPSSQASSYKVRKYTHSEMFRGKEVKYYDCFTVVDDFKYDKPLKDDEPDKRFIRRAEKVFKRKK